MFALMMAEDRVSKKQRYLEIVNALEELPGIDRMLFLDMCVECSHARPTNYVRCGAFDFRRMS